MWLINLVENLLSITRLVEGRLNLNITEDLVDDVVAEALRHVNKKSAEHTIVTESGEEFLLARMDPRLIVQVIINIVNNAIEYTPVGSHITIRSEKRMERSSFPLPTMGLGSQIRKSPGYSICFTAEGIRSPTAGATAASVFPSAGPS